MKNTFCPNCKKQIDFTKSINLKNPNQAKQISFIFVDTEIEMKKMMKALKYQKIQQRKYINFLETKIDNLLKENNSLKETIKVKSINNNTNNNNYNNYQNNPQKTNNESFDGRNIIDLSQIRKIEPKSGNRPSKKINNFINDDYTSNINNLNVQTASEQFKKGNQHNILNININNTNRNGYSHYFNNMVMETPINNNNNVYRNGYNNLYDNPNKNYRY
jgi:hypothetical protein